MGVVGVFVELTSLFDKGIMKDLTVGYELESALVVLASSVKDSDCSLNPI
jgi:hypothetical protein